MTETQAPSDVFVDKILVQLYNAKAPTATREMVDKVFRPFLVIMDEHHASGASSHEMADAIENTLAMMVTNFCYRVGGNIEEWADISQEMINNIAAVMSSDIAHRDAEQNAKEKGNVIQLPTRN